MAYGVWAKEHIVLMKLRKSSLYLFGIILIIAFGIAFVSSGKATGNAVNNVFGEAQIVKLSVVGGNYILSPNTLKKDVPVRLEADSSVQGCAKSIVINAFNVRKIISSSDNAIEFIPDKAGTFNIACSMNMYKGTFSVADSSGKVGNYAEPANTKAASCGANGGGCGCGGF